MLLNLKLLDTFKETNKDTLGLHSDTFMMIAAGLLLPQESQSSSASYPE